MARKSTQMTPLNFHKQWRTNWVAHSPVGHDNLGWQIRPQDQIFVSTRGVPPGADSCLATVTMDGRKSRSPMT